MTPKAAAKEARRAQRSLTRAAKARKDFRKGAPGKGKGKPWGKGLKGKGNAKGQDKGKGKDIEARKAAARASAMKEHHTPRALSTRIRRPPSEWQAR